MKNSVDMGKKEKTYNKFKIISTLNNRTVFGQTTSTKNKVIKISRVKYSIVKNRRHGNKQ